MPETDTAGTASCSTSRADVPRRSLVVLPLALALPDTLAVAAVVVVTRTLVEVLGMIVCVRAIPRLLPATDTRSLADQR